MIDLSGPATLVAPLLLGAVIEGRGVAVRITEVEAYEGANDPGSHGYRGPRVRNRNLFGAPGLLYVYRSYGIHACCNVVCGVEGESSAVLLRAGEVIAGQPIARQRRGCVPADVALARGPGNLGQALGAVLPDDDGTSLLDGSGPYALTAAPGLEAMLTAASPASVVESLLSERLPNGTPRVSSGPRTGVSGTAGGRGFPWRFWLTGDPTVSGYRRHPTAED